jgi:UDP-glucose 4-epimerase
MSAAGHDVPAGLAARFAGVNCLVTGGLGFIGSNLAIRLVEMGARVTLVDAMMPDYGGNLFNIAPIRDRVTVNFGDICDRHAMDWLVRGQDYVFHLAGQASHVMSLTDPYPDIEYNIKGTVVVMEALRRFNPAARVVFTGTRSEYGPTTKLPVSEDAPTNPKGIYEISNLAAEKIVQVYNDTHGIRTVPLRLTNTYGPRAQMKHARYGVANWFVRLALDDRTIPVFGDGSAVRDFLYVDDCVDAILLAATSDAAAGQVFNVGVDRPTTMRELAETIVRLTGSGRWELAPYTAERKALEPGDFYSDITKIRRALGWQPHTPLEDGLRLTIAYYRAHKAYYW